MLNTKRSASGAGEGRLSGRRVVLTGAGSGIGRATAVLMAAEGATLALLDLREDGLRETYSISSGSTHLVDVSDQSSVELAIARAANAMGGIDGLVNCAGILAIKSLQETTLDVWERVLAVNLTGTYLVCHAALPWLRKEERAAIVNISSGQGLKPFADQTAYAASKGGVIAFTKALASELAPKIRANVICPGFIDTPMTAPEQGQNSIPADFSNYLLGRAAQPSEVAEAILYLISHASSYTTGATLTVDGGRTLY
ncbi:SDR family NAD(P)-dependent oxidoreductase [Mesorhizobium calcicola]|uniref:SDR family NAD(P)-dependent oxidoreductase n=1 Tax=Mesorhizobium calcicola TaxID=1300310 RepID=A0ABW4WEB3_9HYPH